MALPVLNCVTSSIRTVRTVRTVRTSCAVLLQIQTARFLSPTHAVTAVSSSPILVTLMKEALGSSETSVLTGATRRNIPDDTILHSHCRENLKSYIVFPHTVWREWEVTVIVAYARSTARSRVGGGVPRPSPTPVQLLPHCSHHCRPQTPQLTADAPRRHKCAANALL
jgi:hypothetical protein